MRNASTKPKRKMGPRRKLSERGMRLFQKCVLEYSFNPLYVILARFKETADIALSRQTGRRYTRNFSMHKYVAIQNHFCQRDIYRHELHGHALMSTGTWRNGPKCCLQMSHRFLSVPCETDYVFGEN